MLEGLEIKIKQLSETLDNKDFRVDSQFYTKEPYKNPELNYDKIGNLIHNAQYGISIAMNEDSIGYPIYRMNEIHNMLCDIEVSKTADINTNELKNFKLNDRDVVFNRTNSFEWVGRTGLYKKLDDRDFVFASYLVRFIPNEKYLLPEYLTSFLNSKYGVNDIKRRARQSINQTNVNPEEVKSIEIPTLSLNFQNKIKKCFDIGFNNKVVSKQIYADAENLLLKEIGLQDFTPSKEPVNIKNFKDSFATSGRLDAEYYQPKYDDYSKLINNYSGGSEAIVTICNLKGKNFKPEDDKTYNYIELSNVGKTGDINGCTVNLGKELPSRARRKVNTGDVIISSIEGSLESCAMVTKEYNNALCSTGFYVINSDIINSESLLVLFKSDLMQNVLKQNCSGTILTSLNKDDFIKIRIPKIKENIQKNIKSLIEQSFSLKKQSEYLLEVAKKAVEIAIEENEGIAIKYITKESNFKVHDIIF